MSVSVLFFTPRGIGHSDNAPGIGNVRAREEVSVPGTTTETVRGGEAVVVFNGDSAPVLMAFGTAPNALAIVETAATTAGYPVPGSQNSVPMIPNTGAKVHVAAVP